MLIFNYSNIFLEIFSFFAIAQKTKQKKLVRFKGLPAESNLPPA